MYFGPHQDPEPAHEDSDPLHQDAELYDGAARGTLGANESELPESRVQETGETYSTRPKRGTRARSLLMGCTRSGPRHHGLSPPGGMKRGRKQPDPLQVRLFLRSCNSVIQST